MGREVASFAFIPRERDLNERERERRDDSQTIFHFVDERWWISCSFARVARTSRLFRIFCGGEEVSEKRCSLNAALLCKMRFQNCKGNSVFLEKINSLPWFLYNYVRKGRGMFVSLPIFNLREYSALPRPRLVSILFLSLLLK